MSAAVEILSSRVAGTGFPVPVIILIAVFIGAYVPRELALLGLFAAVPIALGWLVDEANDAQESRESRTVATETQSASDKTGTYTAAQGPFGAVEQLLVTQPLGPAPEAVQPTSSILNASQIPLTTVAPSSQRLINADQQSILQIADALPLLSSPDTTPVVVAPEAVASIQPVSLPTCSACAEHDTRRNDMDLHVDETSGFVESSDNEEKQQRESPRLSPTASSQTSEEAIVEMKQAREKAQAEAAAEFAAQLRQDDEETLGKMLPAEKQEALELKDAAMGVGLPPNFTDAYLIGKGYCGAVYRTQDGKSICVAKLLTYDRFDRPLDEWLSSARSAKPQFFKEAMTMKKLSSRASYHPNIVMYMDFQKLSIKQTPNWPCQFIIMERALGGLKAGDVVRKNGESCKKRAALAFLRCMMCALERMEDKQILHRDIKPENILLFGPQKTSSDAATVWDNVKLADFGCAESLFNGTKHDSFVGTEDYAAPESVEKHEYTHGSDVFGTCATWLHGRGILRERVSGETYANRQNEIALVSRNDPFFGDAFADMVERDPFERPSASTVKWRIDQMLKELTCCKEGAAVCV